MKRIQAQQVYYEVGKVLGAGVTSEVYEAFRKDAQGWTEQKVALKILRSKKDVQILKKEFESLSQIRSKFCVRVLAWENLATGSALVLEYIDGVTLKDLVQKKDLSIDLVQEIMAQALLGLQALHKKGICHGDLNLKNIMVNRDGIVKLIDFGFSSSSGEQLMTKSFASPQRLQGHEPTADMDLYSHQKVGEFLFEQLGEKSSFSVRGQFSRGFRRRKLSEWVGEVLESKKCETIRLQRKKPLRKSPIPFFRYVFCLGVFLFLLLGPSFFSKPVGYFPIEVRSNRWFQMSVNSMPPLYGPLRGKKLRQGQYQITLRGPKIKKNLQVQLAEPKTFLLQPELNPL